MEIKTAKFVKSSPTVQEIPKNALPEFAFIGRSNVGKSSLLNFLVEHKDLAKTSAKPGRTRLINHFLINNSFYFVDLPGYGYAKTSKSNRHRWGQNTEEYLLNRPNLKTLFVLLDMSIAPQTADLEFLSWLKLQQIPLVVVLTKMDKLNQSGLHHQTKLFTETLAKILGPNDQVFYTSVTKRRGRQTILDFLQTFF